MMFGPSHSQPSLLGAEKGTLTQRTTHTHSLQINLVPRVPWGPDDPYMVYEP